MPTDPSDNLPAVIDPVVEGDRSERFRKLDSHTRDLLLEAVGLGASDRQAALAAGVGLEALRSWKENADGKDGYPPDPWAVALWEDIRRVRALLVVELSGNVKVISKKDWRAGKFLLESVAPDEYRQTKNIQVTAAGLGGGAAWGDVTKLAAEDPDSFIAVVNDDFDPDDD